MPTNITGNPAAGEAPSPDPDAGTAPISTVPVSGDPVTAASIRQALGNPLDHIAYAKAPFAKASALTQPIQTWRNAALQTRRLIGHQGFLEGKALSWQEDWQNVAMTAKSAVGNGPWGGRWNYSISGDAVGGAIIPLAPGSDPPTLGTPDTGYRASGMLLASNPGGSTPNIEEIETPGQIIFDADTCLVVQWDSYVHMSGSGNHEDSLGISFESLLGLTGSLTSINPIGFAFLCDATGANWKVYFNTFAGSPSTAGAGVAASGRQRFRIEYYGANVADDGVERVIFYINSAQVFNTPISLFSGAPGPLIGRIFFRHYDVATVSWLNVQTLDLNANTWAGNISF